MGMIRFSQLIRSEVTNKHFPFRAHQTFKTGYNGSPFLFLPKQSDSDLPNQYHYFNKRRDDYAGKQCPFRVRQKIRE